MNKRKKLQYDILNSKEVYMYYYGGYQGYGGYPTNGGCCSGGGYGYGSGYGAAILLVLFILLVIIIGARAFDGGYNNNQGPRR